jgi:hypothetical protein
MKSWPEIKASIDREEQSKRAYGRPGAIIKASDGTLYQVQPDGSWRHYHGGANAPV